jgi:phage-related protein (TIGR01555 family)
MSTTMSGPAFLADSLVSLVSNLGNPSKDKGAMGEFVLGPRLSRGTIDALYSQNWIGGKVVDIPADDMVREWRTWKTDKAAVAALEETERKFGVRTLINKALKLAFKDGGSAILLGVPGMGDPATELNVRAMPKGSLQYMILLSRWDLSITEMEYDPASPWFGQAKQYKLLLPEGRDIAIHPSRIVPFQGTMRADQWMRIDPWGESVYQRLHDSIRDATSVQQAVASMVQEAKLDVVKIPGLSENVGRADYRNLLLQRFSTAMMTKSINNTLIFDAEEDYSQKTLTFQGLPDIIDRLLQIIAGAADMPVTRMLGQSPAGLNSTGKADLEGYYSMVRSRQETYLRPSMERLDEVLIRTVLGRRPRGIYSEFRSLWSIPDSDQAKIDLERANAAEAYARAGIFSPEALQQAVIAQLEEDSHLPQIAEAVQAHPGSPGHIQLQAAKVAAESRANAPAPAPAPARATPPRRRQAAPPQTD